MAAILPFVAVILLVGTGFSVCYLTKCLHRKTPCTKDQDGKVGIPPRFWYHGSRGTIYYPGLYTIPQREGCYHPPPAKYYNEKKGGSSNKATDLAGSPVEPSEPSAPKDCEDVTVPPVDILRPSAPPPPYMVIGNTV